MHIKRYFNMVEVILAIVVISVGLGSVFVLFPAGLSAHKNATADNSIADLAELVLSSVRSQIDMDTSSGTNFDAVDWAGYDDKPADAEVDVGTISAWEGLDLLKSGTDDHDALENASLLRNTSKPNVFWVRQMSGPEGSRFVDFSAIARVYVDADSADEEFFLEATSETYKQYKSITGDKVNIDKILLPMVLEISYPAEVAYAEREKRYFRFEILNEHYVKETDPVTP